MDCESPRSRILLSGAVAANRCVTESSTPDDQFSHSALLSLLPLEDQVEFLHLAEDAVSGWALAKMEKVKAFAEAEEYKGTILSLLSLYNSGSRMLRLPTELLMQILHESIDGGWKDLLRLAHVSRQWRATALAMPRIWADALDDLLAESGGNIQNMSTEPLEWLLTLSGDLPILRMVLLPFPWEAVHWRIVKPHCSRLRVARFSAQGSVHAAVWMLNILSSGAPHLEALTILEESSEGDDPARDEIVDAELVPWKDDKLPRLTRLSISAAYFNSAIAVQSLCILILTHQSIRFDNKLLNALERCSMTLEVLGLDSPETQQAPERSPTENQRVVHLPRLRVLQILLDSFSRTQAFVHLSFDTTATSIELGTGDEHDRDFFDTAPPPEHAPPPNYPTPSCDCVRLACQVPSAEIEVRCFSGAKQLLFVEAFPLYSDTLQSMLRLFEHTSVTTLVLDFFLLPHEESVVPIVESFPNLRRLELMMPSRNIKSKFADAFLQVCRALRGGAAWKLTLAWVVDCHIDPNTYAREWEAVEAEMAALRGVLEAHRARGGGKLGSVRIYIPSFIGDLERGEDVFRAEDVVRDEEFSRRVVEEVVPDLQSFADSVVVGGIELGETMYQEMAE